jgi:hypothetical protein
VLLFEDARRHLHPPQDMMKHEAVLKDKQSGVGFCLLKKISLGNLRHISSLL